MDTYKKNWFKFIVGFIICTLIRLLPGRPPNIEPILGTQMPFSRAYGALPGFLFAFFSMLMFDFIVGKFGVWSFLTATAYGILGIFAFSFFKNKKNTIAPYISFAIMGTLFYDALTGLTIGPLFFHQPFVEALIGQIPFTGLHLVGNVFFAIVLSPALYRYVVQNEKFESSALGALFHLQRSN